VNVRAPLNLLLVFFALPLFAAEQTILFVDDQDIVYRAGTRRVLHQPRRHEGNPLIVGATIKNQISYCSVYRDTASGKYQMWYQVTGGGS